MLSSPLSSPTTWGTTLLFFLFCFVLRNCFLPRFFLLFFPFNPLLFLTTFPTLSHIIIFFLFFFLFSFHQPLQVWQKSNSVIQAFKLLLSISLTLAPSSPAHKKTCEVVGNVVASVRKNLDVEKERRNQFANLPLHKVFFPFYFFCFFFLFFFSIFFFYFIYINFNLLLTTFPPSQSPFL